jgi:hypothetical protein
MPLLKKKLRLGAKSSIVHATAQVIFEIGKSVGESERQLGNRICARLCNMIATYADAVKIPDVIVNKILLNITHKLKRKFSTENAGVLSLVFF